MAVICGLLAAWGCGDDTVTPPAPVEVVVTAEAGVATVEPRPSTPHPDRVFGRCSVAVTVAAAGGRPGDAAVFVSGEWRRIRSYNTTPPMEETPATFTDRFGTDRIPVGAELHGGGTFWAFNLTSEPWVERFTARFRLPDGAMVSRQVDVPCDP